MQNNGFSNKRILLSISNIHKSFGSNKVLKGVNLELAEGEVISVIGGNGAGKSTLMKIIMGIYKQDKGDIFIKEKKVLVAKPAIALSHGIYMVPQEPMLFPNMTVEENITIGFNENPAELHKRLVELINQIGWEFDLKRKASSLSIAEQQLVEILRGLLRRAKILILDEPTSTLTFDEVESLFKCILDLKQKGIGILYITHRLNEVFQISTGVAIMRDGQITLSGDVENFTKEDLVAGLLPSSSEKKVSKETEKVKTDYKNSQPIMKIEKLSGYGFNNISFNLYPGEILGIAGVVGAGRSELAKTIFGRDKVISGKIILNEKEVTGLSTKKIIEEGINFVPEDRHIQGLFKIADITSNTTSSILSKAKIGKFFINRKNEKEVTQKYVDDFKIKITGQSQIVGSLSGGNQQKIVIGRSLTTAPKVVILDEPTRGIDAGARRDVYLIINELKRQGVSVLLISSDMEEIVELSDRALTVYQGRINAEFGKNEINEDNLMSYSFGINNFRSTSH